MILIDTYNVLHTPGVLPLGLAGLDVDGLCRLIGAGRYAAREITLVCDGHGRDTRRGSMRVVFAADSGDADSWIEERLARDSAPRRIMVVSSDRRVRRAADKAGAAVVSSARFLAQLAIDLERTKPKPRPRFATDVPLDALSVAYWAGQFGLSREEMARLDAESRAITAGGEGREWGVGSGESGKSKKAEKTRREGVKDEPHMPPALGEGLPAPEFDARALAEDPVIRSALEHWSGRLSLDDLDMGRWLDQAGIGGPVADGLGAEKAADGAPMGGASKKPRGRDGARGATGREGHQEGRRKGR